MIGLQSLSVDVAIEWTRQLRSYAVELPIAVEVVRAIDRTRADARQPIIALLGLVNPVPPPESTIRECNLPQRLEAYRRNDKRARARVAARVAAREASD